MRADHNRYHKPIFGCFSVDRDQFRSKSVQPSISKNYYNHSFDLPINKMSQVINLKTNVISSKKTPWKTTPPIQKEKNSIQNILEKIKTSREPPQINDPFICLKKLKVEPKQEETEKDYEKEKQRQDELLALLIGDIMSG